MLPRVKKIISYVRLIISYVRLIISYVRDNQSYVRDNKSHVRDNKSYVRDIFSHVAAIRFRMVQCISSKKFGTGLLSSLMVVSGMCSTLSKYRQPSLLIQALINFCGANMESYFMLILSYIRLLFPRCF